MRKNLLFPPALHNSGLRYIRQILPTVCFLYSAVPYKSETDKKQALHPEKIDAVHSRITFFLDSNIRCFRARGVWKETRIIIFASICVYYALHNRMEQVLQSTLKVANPSIIWKVAAAWRIYLLMRQSHRVSKITSCPRYAGTAYGRITNTFFDWIKALKRQVYCISDLHML